MANAITANIPLPLVVVLVISSSCRFAGSYGYGRHISPETLTEYLDGRLRSQTREKLDRVMAGCAECRLEMESLRDTVAMLRRLPVMTPQRSFIMSAPPQGAPQTVRRARPISPFRVPQWAYAGAASLAALALAVLVSVDASGLVAPDPPNTAILQRSENAPAAAGLEVLTKESAGAKNGSQGETARKTSEALSIQVESDAIVEAPAVAEMQAQAPAVAEMPAQAPQTAALQAEAPAVAETQAQALQTAALQAEAPAVAETRAQAPQAAATDVKTPTEKSLEAPAVQLRMTEEPVVKSVLREQAAQPTAAETAPVQFEKASNAQPETVEVLPVPTVDPVGATSEPAQVQETRIITADEFKPLVTQRTPLIWRLLEGAVATLFLALVAVFYLRRRAARRF